MVLRIDNINSDQQFEEELKKYIEYKQMLRSKYIEKIDDLKEKSKKVASMPEFKSLDELDQTDIAILKSSLSEKELKQCYRENGSFSLMKLQLKAKLKKMEFIGLESQISNWEKKLKELDEYDIVLNKNKLTEENILKIKKYCSTFLEMGEQVFVCIDDDISRNNEGKINYIYSAEELQKLVELNEYLMNKGMKKELNILELVACESAFSKEESWSISKIIGVNNEINRIVEEIKSKNLSPFETMLEIHRYVTNRFSYDESTKLFNSRVLPGILTENKIVCSGYATMVKAIVDLLDMPELKCDLAVCDFYDSKAEIKTMKHSYNLIHIEDKKYKINGTYVEDACSDSNSRTSMVNNGEPIGFGFANCLYPVDDLLHINGLKYKSNDSTTRYGNIIGNSKTTELNIKLKNEKNIFKKMQILSESLINNINIYKIPEIIKSYKAKSKPIDIEKYKKALLEIYEDEERVENILTQTKNCAKSIFDSNALSNFVNEKEDKKEKI